MVKLRLPRGLFMAAGGSSDSSTVNLAKFLNVRPWKARTPRLPLPLPLPLPPPPSPSPPPPPVVLGVSSSDENNDRSEATDNHNILCEKPTGSADDDHVSGNSKRTLEGTEINNGSGGKGDKIQKTDSPRGGGEIKGTDDDRISKTSSTSSDIDIKNQVVSSVDQNVVPRRYACSVCGKTFSSHLALGGHKSSHTKFKMVVSDAVDLRARDKQLSVTNTSDPQAATRPRPLGDRLDRTHTCKICLEKFPSGQALGGHQRRHWTGNTHKAPKILDFDLNELPKVEDDQDPSAILSS